MGLSETVLDLKKRISDLEGKVRSQQVIMLRHMEEHERSVEELKEIIASLKKDLGSAAGFAKKGGEWIVAEENLSGAGGYKKRAREFDS